MCIAEVDTGLKSELYVVPCFLQGATSQKIIY